MFTGPVGPVEGFFTGPHKNIIHVDMIFLFQWTACDVPYYGAPREEQWESQLAHLLPAQILEVRPGLIFHLNHHD